jgi:hypothetical protein
MLGRTGVVEHNVNLVDFGSVPGSHINPTLTILYCELLRYAGVRD